ncbi:phosphopantetheine-binding protein [Saccharothrix yanglingensis]|uniref:Phosphopantetheine-binding protein n=1 Tax=Saccharothrix yanglingensis TaxID=659496 RepID=A0ABU0X3J9_9PSEU|nr:phosphopantetheine-binding protein [Saccharothrix yanglingensis]MDQ2586708.1 phosphopantetheine-binding protein [Saccharothrix yanglingensis]
MTAPDAQLDADLRHRVVEAMTAVLARLVERDEPITEDVDMADGLGVSSSMGLELLLEVEEQVGIQIDVEKMRPDELRTVGELATFIAGHSRPW